MTFCTYCDSPEYEHSLHGDLRNLDPELVDKYAWDAIHHTGDANDFKHFVPRVFELLAQHRLPFADPELVIGRLDMAEWSSWDTDERAAISALLDALWDDAMRLMRPPVEIDDLVCGLSLAYRGVPPQLENWLTDTRPLAAERLVELILTNAITLRNGRLSDPWWEPVPVASMLKWLASDEVYWHLELWDPADHLQAVDAVQALDSLRMLERRS